MKTIPTQTKPLILKSFFIFLFLSLSLFYFIFSSNPLQNTTSVSKPLSQYHHQNHDLKIRSGFNSYETYIQHQLNKTLNPKLRKLWLTRDWNRKIEVFSEFFKKLQNENLLFNDSKSLCIGARVGQEVAALKRIGVSNSIGIDLVPYPPLVVKGDFHHQPFDDNTFDFEFSNVFDHALYPSKFVDEIERTLKPGGICTLHVALSGRGDKYSANDLYNSGVLIGLFRVSEMVHVRRVDGFGLDTEIVFRKKLIKQ